MHDATKSTATLAIDVVNEKFGFITIMWILNDFVSEDEQSMHNQNDFPLRIVLRQMISQNEQVVGRILLHFG